MSGATAPHSPRSMRRNYSPVWPSASLFTAAASLVAPSLPSPTQMPPPPPEAPRCRGSGKHPRRPSTDLPRCHPPLNGSPSLPNSLVVVTGFPFSSVTRSHWFLICASRHHPELGLAALVDGLKKSSRPSFSFLESLISSLCVARRYDDALKVFDAMFHLGFPNNPRAAGAIIEGMCRNGDVGLAVGLLKGWNGRPFLPDLSAYNAVFDRLCHRSGAFLDALQVFDGMLSAGIPPDAATYSSLVKCFCKAGWLELALDLLGGFIKRGCKAKGGIGMMNTIVGALVSAGRIFDARAFFIWMPEMGCTPNVFTCNFLLRGLFQARDVAAALEFYREMSIQGGRCAPNMFTYNTLIGFLCKVGYLNEAVYVFDEMVARGFSPHVVTFNIFMDFLCKRGLVEEARDLFELIPQWKVMPTKISYNILIHGYCMMGRMGAAEKLFDAMARNGMKPNIVSYNTLCGGYCNLGEMGRANMVLKDMVMQGVSPNPVTSAILVHAYCRRGKLRMASEYIDNMRQNGVEPSVSTYNSVIDVHGLRGDMNGVFKIVEQMKCHPDQALYSTIMKAFCNMNEMTEALKVFDMMLHGGFRPEVITCTTLLHGLFKANRPFCALQLFSEMESLGIKPTGVTYKTIMSGLEKAWKITNDCIVREELKDKAREISFLLHNYYWQMLSDTKIIKAWMRSLVK